MADRAAVQMAGKADGLPGQHAFGSFIHGTNILDPMRGQKSSSFYSQGQNEFQSPHPVSQSAGLQNGYGVSNNNHPRISDIQRPGHFAYQNGLLYHSNNIHTQNSLQAVYSSMPQLAQCLPSQRTLNPANMFHNQRPQLTLRTSQLQNSVLSQGNFQQTVHTSQGYGQQNQQILALHNLFQPSAPSEHSRVHMGTSVQTLLAANTQQQYSSPHTSAHATTMGGSGHTLPGHPQPQQWYNLSKDVPNACTVPSEQTNIHVQRPPEMFLPGNQQQCNSSNTSSGAQPVPSQYSSSIQVQRPLQTFLPSNPQQQYNSSNTSIHTQRLQHAFLLGNQHQQCSSSNTVSVANPVNSEHSNNILQTILAVNPQQQYSSSNTISDAHLIPCPPRDNSLISSIHSPKASVSCSSYTVSVSSPANLYSTGNMFKDNTKTSSIKSSLSPSSTTVHITTMPLQQQERQKKSIDNISNEFGFVRKLDSAVYYGMSRVPQGHSSPLNPADGHLPSPWQNSQAAAQQPYLNNCHILHDMLSSYQPVGVSLPKPSFHSESNDLVTAVLQQKRDLDVNCGNSNSHPLASANGHNLNQGGESEFRAAHGHCSMKTIEQSTNTSVHVSQWYRYPETLGAPSFQSDIEAMQADIISHTTSCKASSSICMTDPSESRITSRKSPPDAYEEVQINSASVARTDVNLSGRGSLELGYRVINTTNRSEELTGPIKQEPPEDFRIPEANLSAGRVNTPNIGDLSPPGVRSISVLNGGYNCSTVTDDPGTSNTSFTKNNRCSPLTESSSHGICAKFLSDVDVSAGIENVVAADLQTPEGRVDILQLPEVGTNQKLTMGIQSGKSSYVSPAASSGINAGLHHLNTLANPDVSPHVHTYATSFQPVSSHIVDSGLLEDAALSDMNTPEKVNATGLLNQHSVQINTNYVNINHVLSETNTGLLAKPKHDIFPPEKHLDEDMFKEKSNERRLAEQPDRLQNRRHTSPCPVKNAEETCKSSALRLSMSRQSLDSSTSGHTSRQSKLHSRVQHVDAQNVSGQRQCIIPNLTDSKSTRKPKYWDQKQSSSSENYLSAKEKVHKTWKEGQIVKNNRTGKKIQRNGNAEIAGITNHSTQTIKSPDLKPTTTNHSVVKETNNVNQINKTNNKVVTGKPVSTQAKKSRSSTKQKSASSICYVKIHGYKLICLKSKTEALILLCEFQSTCFPDKTLLCLNNCIDKILKIKKKLLVHPEKEMILNVLKKHGYDTNSSIYTISVKDGRKIYHHLNSIRTCTSTMCMVEEPAAVSCFDLTMKNSTAIDSLKSLQVSAAETWQSCIDSPTRQCSDDSLNPRLCIDLFRDALDSDDTLAYGEISGSFSGQDEIENSLVIRWLPGTPKIGGLLDAHLGNIRSYSHEGEIFLAVDDLCRIFCITEFYEYAHKENIPLYSCCQEIKRFLNELDLNLPAVKSQHQSLVKEADIGFHKNFDSVCHNLSQDRSPVPKRPLCTQGVCNEYSTPHKQPRLEGEALLTDSQNHMTLKLGPIFVKQEDNCQSVLSPVRSHDPCESCPDSNLERTEVTGLKTMAAQLQKSAGESSQVPAVSRSISNRSTPCLDTDNFLTSASDRHIVEKYVNNSKKLVQQSESEMLHMTYMPIDITSPVDTDSCCRNTDTMFDHSVIRQYDLISPNSDRSAFSPAEQSLLICDNSGNPDALPISGGEPTLNEDSAVEVHRNEDGSPDYEVIVLPLKESDSVGDNNTYSTRDIVKSKSDAHRDDVSDVIMCDAYVADKVSNRNNTADVLACGELSPEDEVVHRSTPELAGWASDECMGPAYLLPSSEACWRFQRCVDDMDIVTCSKTNLLVTSDYRKAYVQLWQQTRALLGDITRLKQRAAFSEAEKEKAYKKCKFYEDLVHDITSTFKCGDRS